MIMMRIIKMIMIMIMIIKVIMTMTMTMTMIMIMIEKMWGVKTTTVPVIIGTFGLVKTGTENYIGNIRITELHLRLSCT